jgi:hypothetical protein
VRKKHPNCSIRINVMDQYWTNGDPLATTIPCPLMLFVCQRGEAIRGCVHGSAKRGDFSIHVIGCMHAIRPVDSFNFFVFLQWVIDWSCSILLIAASEKGVAGANCLALPPVGCSQGNRIRKYFAREESGQRTGDCKRLWSSLGN